MFINICSQAPVTLRAMASSDDPVTHLGTWWGFYTWEDSLSCCMPLWTLCCSCSNKTYGVVLQSLPRGPQIHAPIHVFIHQSHVLLYWYIGTQHFSTHTHIHICLPNLPTHHTQPWKNMKQSHAEECGQHHDSHVTLILCWYGLY